MIPDLGEDLISCLCLGVKSRALVLIAMAEKGKQVIFIITVVVGGYL
jgi:hypothetical protein